MFESNTYENLLKDVLDNAPEDIDTRQGSIFYDAVSGILVKIAKLYTDLELIFSLSQIDTASGEYLDMKASEYGIERHAAVNAEYEAILIGTVAEENARFFYNGMYFALSGNVFTAEEPGESYNGIYPGTNAVPVDSAPTLNSAEFGNIIQYGADSEDDESLRRRLKDKISGTGENGNKQHYRIWCESVDGVGKARIYPLWNGPNTVKAVLISPSGLDCGSVIVNKVQQYVDPNTQGLTVLVGGTTYNVGDGLGEGTAGIGAHFTAVSAVREFIDISVSVEINSEVSLADIKAEIENRIAAYLKSIVMETPDSEEVVIRTSAVGAIIAGIDNVVDYSNLTINAGDANITVNNNNVPVTGAIYVESI